MAFSLYIHIPYCVAKCPYCGFNSHAATSWPEDRYTAAIIAEIRHRGTQTPFAGCPVKTIFFGGGTPSLFQPASIARILESVAATCGIADDTEITLEANPGTVAERALAGFRAAGVNRIRFGAQSFNPAILKYLGRIHTAEETRSAARAARQVGFARLNLDLIFAVPGQTLADVRRDLMEAVALEPDHVSAYNLTFEPGTAFFADLQRGRIRPLDEDLQAAMYALVRDELPQQGYPMYELSNFGPRGHEARHNLSYWRGASYLGIGAGAHSFAGEGAGGRRWWNEKLPARYLTLVEGRGEAEAGSEVIDGRTAMGEFVFLNLRLRSGLDSARFRSRFGCDFDEVFGSVAARLTAGGVLLREGGWIRLSERGLEVADSVFAEFL